MHAQASSEGKAEQSPAFKRWYAREGRRDVQDAAAAVLAAAVAPD